VHKRCLRKPDGRRLHLYGFEPIEEDIVAPSPSREPWRPNSHLRWHPLRGEWVIYAAHRQNRTFLPPEGYDPLGPTDDAAHPTELPPGNWQVAVFDNLFPALSGGAHAPPLIEVQTRPGLGACEVVVYTQASGGSLGGLPVRNIALLIEVWAERYRELGAREDVQYVFAFENRGAAVGATLHHPHGQIYAYPFLPPVPARELEMQRRHFAVHGHALLEAMIADEVRERARMLYEDERAVAFVPVCARYAYEVWVAPRRAVPSLAALEREDREALARALKSTLLRLDGLWSQPMPYVLVVSQAPTDGAAHPEAHAHVQIYPAYRLPGRLKYLAGSELGAGVFTADTLPEDKAAELRAVEVNLD